MGVNDVNAHIMVYSNESIHDVNIYVMGMKGLNHKKYRIKKVGDYPHNIFYISFYKIIMTCF